MKLSESKLSRSICESNLMLIKLLTDDGVVKTVRVPVKKDK